MAASAAGSSTPQTVKTPTKPSGGVGDGTPKHLPATANTNSKPSPTKSFDVDSFLPPPSADTSSIDNFLDGDDDVSVADVSGGGGAAVTALDDSSDEGSCNPMVMTARQDFQEEDMAGVSAKIGDSSASRLRRYSSSSSSSDTGG